MAVCNLTRRIPSNQCIGDSLRTINANFSALDTGLCSLPTINEGESFDLNLKITSSSKRAFYELTPNSFPIFQTSFDWTSSHIQEQSISLEAVEDLETGYKAYVFPRDTNPVTSKPTATFTAVSENVGFPKITLFWTASSSDELSTIYALNSATPSMETNGEVFTFYKDNVDNVLYLGGSFTQIGTTQLAKLGTIFLGGGSPTLDLGMTGRLEIAEMPINFPVFTTGTINSIQRFETSNQKLLIFGGTFISETGGRGLLVYDENSNVYRTFYFNGEVHSILIDGVDLYVAGQFDWANTGASPAGSTSNERVFCNNLAKLKLEQIGSVNAFDTTFLVNSSAVLNGSTAVHAVVRFNNALHIGGEFEILSENGEYLHKNFLSLSLDGTRIEEWTFIVDKPIYTILLDNSLLYLGGQFNIVSSYDDFYAVTDVERTERIRFYHAAVIDLTNETAPVVNKQWKPKFNDTVYYFTPANGNLDSFLYASGIFTELNSISVGYVAAVSKATQVLNQGTTGQRIPWNVYLETAPSLYSKNLLVDDTNVYIGGRFSKVNNKNRRYYCKVAGALQSPIDLNPKAIEFEVGGQIVSQNQSLVFDPISLASQTITTFSGPTTTVNRTTFPPLIEGFEGLRPNQLCRFYLKRPSLNDTLDIDIHVLGWTISFEKNI